MAFDGIFFGGMEIKILSCIAQCRIGMMKSMRTLMKMVSVMPVVKEIIVEQGGSDQLVFICLQAKHPIQLDSDVSDGVNVLVNGRISVLNKVFCLIEPAF